MSRAEFAERLSAEWPELSPEQRARVVAFYQSVCDENERQNLTRLISPADFIEGHVVDVRELLKSELVQFPAMDLGSGVGVPGLLAALVRDDQWVLSESEGHKAAFLARIVSEMGLSARVSVTSERGEQYLKAKTVESIVSRAVGKVEKLYTWLRPCSTWNNLVLLKGPGWEDEWKSFQQTKFRKELEVSGTHSYAVGAEQKKRIIVRVSRIRRA